MDLSPEQLDEFIADIDRASSQPKSLVKDFCDQFGASLDQHASGPDELVSLRARLAYLASRVALSQGRASVAEDRAREAVSLALEASDVSLQSLSLATLGVVHGYAGRQVDATQALSDALESAQMLGDDFVLARVHYCFGAIYEVQNEYEQSLQHAHDALEHAVAADELAVECQIRGAIGYTLGQLDQPDEGIAWINEALEKCSEGGFHGIVDNLLGYLIAVLRRAGLFDEGRRAVAELLRVIDGLSVQNAAAMCVQAAELEADVGRYPEAAALLQRADELTDGEELYGHSLHYFDVAARVHEALGDHRLALKMYKEFVKRAEQNRGGSAEARLLVAERRHVQERMEQASQIHQKWTAEMLEKYAELSTLNAEKTEFLQVVAHNLQNSLAAMLMTTRALAEQHELLDSRDLASYLRKLTELSQQMTDTVAELLVDSPDTGTRSSPSLQAVPLVTVCRSVIEQFQFVAGQKRIVMAFEPDDRSVVGRADPKLLRRVVENLVSNAIKYSPPGSMVSVNVARSGSTAILTVTDEGSGFTESDRDRVFEKFSMLSAQPTGGESSTGLGLFIAKRLVEAMNAEIRLEPAGPTPGSTFTVMLPLSD